MKRAAARVLAIAALAAAGIARAACPIAETRLEGIVVSAADGSPVAGATLEAGWDERAAGRMTVSRESGADGAFALRVAFDTYSGRTLAGRDVCEAQLQAIDLRIEHPAFRPLERRIARAAFGEALRIELRTAD
ncbi:MAG: carboxypeptidase-like regulatory domain-containing protein [Xanthomonadaceae bacterium]|jgi:hypothetical protein|nr:carboxypeptidase-like regulatory domain-containing protein [Xanthomonadaceae bacterium]